MSIFGNMLKNFLMGSIDSKEYRKIILSFDNGSEKFTLPITPKEIFINDGQSNKTVNISEAGEINLLGYRILKTLNLESFFPNHEYPFIVSDELKSPNEYIAILRRWKESKKPIRVLVTKSDINYAMSIESIKSGTRDGSGDVYFSLSLKEYRFLNIPDANNDKQIDDVTGLKERPTENTIPTTVTVKKNQDIMDIAKKTYSDFAHWKRVAESNSISDLAILKAGDVLKVK